jgi:hypothetical protein
MLITGSVAAAHGWARMHARSASSKIAPAARWPGAGFTMGLCGMCSGTATDGGWNAAISGASTTADLTDEDAA